MKKLIILLLPAFLLASCVTNKITPYNALRVPQPPSVKSAYVTSLVPGLTQLKNGEKGEAYIYPLAMGLGMLIAFSAYADGEATLGQASLGAGAAILIVEGINYYDGIYTTKVRNWDYGRREEIAAQAELLRAQRKRQNELYRQMNPSLANINQLFIGMSTVQAVGAIGSPDHINRTVTASGKYEQWVYSKRRQIGDAVYLYFENGVLTGWQD